MFTIVAYPCTYTTDVNFHIVRVSDGAIVGSIDEDAVEELGAIFGMSSIDYFTVECTDVSKSNQTKIPFEGTE